MGDEASSIVPTSAVQREKLHQIITIGTLYLLITYDKLNQLLSVIFLVAKLVIIDRKM
jgi:hypothetical protein